MEIYAGGSKITAAGVKQAQAAGLKGQVEIGRQLGP
jgi:hypothetical protein